MTLAFYELCQVDMFDVVENDNYIFCDVDQKSIPRGIWIEKQKH